MVPSVQTIVREHGFKFTHHKSFSFHWVASGPLLQSIVERRVLGNAGWENKCSFNERPEMFRLEFESLFTINEGFAVRGVGLSKGFESQFLSITNVTKFFFKEWW